MGDEVRPSKAFVSPHFTWPFSTLNFSSTISSLPTIQVIPFSQLYHILSCNLCWSLITVFSSTCFPKSSAQQPLSLPFLLTVLSSQLKVSLVLPRVLVSKVNSPYEHHPQAVTLDLIHSFQSISLSQEIAPRSTLASKTQPSSEIRKSQPTS